VSFCALTDVEGKGILLGWGEGGILSESLLGRGDIESDHGGELMARTVKIDSKVELGEFYGGPKKKCPGKMAGKAKGTT